ncbi:MAG: MFS transporter [Pseudomonadota bacterium]
MSSTAEVDNSAVRWNELLNRNYLPILVTLCMALWLHATNSMLTATTMPSAVEEIGGLHLISWTFALYLAGSITAAASMSIVVGRFGLRKTMMRAALIYTLGCIIIALAPNMPVLLIGRVFQGLGGGSMIALVYVSQDRFFTNRLVPKVVALHSMVWMLAAFSGPAIGGAFATWGVWRWSFWFFALQGLMLVPAIHYLMKKGERESDSKNDRIPVFRISLLCGAILAFSLSGAYFHHLRSPVLIVLGCIAIIAFIYRDRVAVKGRILPLEVSRISHSIANGIATTFLLSICIMSFLVYGPFILIELYSMSPLEAGFVVLIESLAWGSAAVMISGISSDREPLVIRSGSAMVVFGLALIGISFSAGHLWLVIVAIIILNGGMGMMWGFIIKRVIGAAPKKEKDRTASLLPITQQTGFALGAALSGLIANSLGIENLTLSGQLQNIVFWLFMGFIPLAMMGNWAAWRFVSTRLQD